MCFSKPKAKTPGGFSDALKRAVSSQEQSAPALDSAAVEAAMAKERELARRRKGRSSTILAGELSGGSGAPKTLLGS